MALRIRSLSCSSRPPSVWAWSTMPTSSSSVMPSSPLARKTRLISFFHWLNRKFSGVKTTMNSLSRGWANMAKSSGRSLDMLLGVISPKTRMIMVRATVATVGPYWWNHRVHSTVDTVVAVMLTMLLPMRMVDSSLSYSSASARVLAARRLPLSARVFRRMRFREVNAVSVAEK